MTELDADPSLQSPQHQVGPSSLHTAHSTQSQQQLQGGHTPSPQELGSEKDHSTDGMKQSRPDLVELKVYHFQHMTESKSSVSSVSAERRYTAG